MSEPGAKRRKSSSNQRQSHTRRSVLGCLTCRRRKVKCDGQTAPCANCRRLRLDCTPSFHTNFKSWISSNATASGVSGAVNALASPPPEETSAQDHPGPTSLAASGNTSPPLASLSSPHEPSESVGNADTRADDWVLRHSTWDSVVNTGFGDSAARQSPYIAPSFDTNSVFPMSPDVAMRTLEPEFLDFREPLANLDLDEMPAFSFPTNTTLSQDWNFSSAIDSLFPQVDDDQRLIRYYKQHLSSFLSVKSANSIGWNFYSYVIRSPEGQSDSPVRHSILAWTCSHLMLKNLASSPYTRNLHYSRATSATSDLIAGLAMAMRSQTSSGGSVRKRLNMLLSASLFLTHCDVMYGDHESLANRLASIKELLDFHWDRFKEALGPLECRILIWLAYLDLRSNFWTTSKPPNPQSGASSCPEDQASSPRGQLFSFLMARKGLSSLRSGRGSRYYLTECFGQMYPEKELQEDLLQEPAKLLSDEAMSIFSNIRDFDAWNDDVSSRCSTHATLIEELKAAKIDAIRANIARIRAECKVIHAELLHSSTGPDHVARTEFHCLTTTALHLSATIMLNRIASPHIRTDDESQAAALELVRITRRLRKSGSLCSPRSLIWPMPIFIAGIEVTDEVYQDWILDYMLELADWGISTRKARELLKSITDKQANLGRRIKVGDAMKEFSEVVMI